MGCFQWVPNLLFPIWNFLMISKNQNQHEISLELSWNLMKQLCAHVYPFDLIRNIHIVWVFWKQMSIEVQDEHSNVSFRETFPENKTRYLVQFWSRNGAYLPSRRRSRPIALHFRHIIQRGRIIGRICLRSWASDKDLWCYDTFLLITGICICPS